MRTYTPDQWLRNWFIGGPPRVSYNANSQIRTADPRSYTEELSKAWRNIAKSCANGAHVIIRVGCLPSIPVDAAVLVRRSLHAAESGWKVARVRRAGTASQGKRQADQFGRQLGVASEEADIFATLEL
jgi:hypothetical protein